MALIASLDVSPYTLTYRDGGGSRSGALLRAHWDDGATGYADVHPWTELGEPTLEAVLASLASAHPVPLGARALHLARVDAVARRERRWLMDGLVVPRSHATVVDPRFLSTARITELERLGFDTLKLKISPDTLATVVELAELVPPHWRLRLDANARFDGASVHRLVCALEKLSPRLDFVEDPTPNGAEWARLERRGAIPWASDWVPCPDPDVRVLKANAREPLAAMAEETCVPERWVVTSALDHPVGQLFAAWEAARAQAKYGDWVDTCGLATHLVYQANPFSERIAVANGRLAALRGTGIGFDDLWPALPWTSLHSA